MYLKSFFNDSKVKFYRDNDNNIIVKGNLYVFDDNITKIPVKFYKLIGNIYWYGQIDGFKSGNLKTLENFPDIVTGSVSIYKNKNLTSLDGCPKYIGESLYCDNCNISNIDGLKGVTIKKNFIANNNPISDINALNDASIGETIELIETPFAKNYIEKYKKENEYIERINLIKDSSILINYFINN